MKKLLISTAMLALSAVAAHASIIAVLQSVTSIAPMDYRYTYTASLAEDQGMKSGSYFVLYDFRGLISGSETASNGAFSATEQLTGPYPFVQSPSDSAGIPNVIFNYTGPNLNYDPGNTTYMGTSVDLGTFTIDSIYGGLTSGLQSGESVKNTGLDVDARAGNTTAIELPAPNAVPEPSTLGVVGLGVLGLAGAMRRRRA